MFSPGLWVTRSGRRRRSRQLGAVECRLSERYNVFTARWLGQQQVPRRPLKFFWADASSSAAGEIADRGSTRAARGEACPPLSRSSRFRDSFSAYPRRGYRSGAFDPRYRLSTNCSQGRGRRRSRPTREPDNAIIALRKPVRFTSSRKRSAGFWAEGRRNDA